MRILYHYRVCLAWVSGFAGKGHFLRRSGVSSSSCRAPLHPHPHLTTLNRASRNVNTWSSSFPTLARLHHVCALPAISHPFTTSLSSFLFLFFQLSSTLSQSPSLIILEDAGAACSYTLFALCCVVFSYHFATPFHGFTTTYGCMYGRGGVWWRLRMRPGS